MSELLVSAIIVAQPGKAEILQAELSKLIPPTLEEEGCLSYVLHRDLENDGTFVFLEKWQSGELLDQHLQSDHIAAFQAVAGDLVESLSIHRLEAI